MGDKTKIGMDVGHADNNPLNNDPANLRNEDPSKNRREPRLRTELRIDPKTSSEEDIKNQIKYHEKMRDKFSGNPRAKKAQNDDIKRLQGILKDRGFKEEVELDELSSMLPWLDRAVAKVSQISHPKGWANIVQRYVNGMKDKEHQKHPSAWAAEIARQHKGIEPRDLVKYINKLVDKGKLPTELKAEYEVREVFSFKEFTQAIQEVKQDKDVHTKKFKQMFGEKLSNSATQKDYIDDFEKSDAPQFQGKSKEKRREMAIAAYLSKNENYTHELNEWGEITEKDDKSGKELNNPTKGGLDERLRI
jgi:hypothetical protein